ncbi:hypothetical protein V5799_008758 [Amblyomma americanum]|uniref:Uncharacterized protein n=1 Tax=Amblyomma americanum TaxID=6943 RepID=A0AAQ4FC38_AMBAM
MGQSPNAVGTNAVSPVKSSSRSTAASPANPPPDGSKGAPPGKPQSQTAVASPGNLLSVNANAASPVMSAMASAVPSPENLPGSVNQYSRATVQEGVYVVIGHGPYQYRVLFCGILATTVSLLHILSDQLLVRPVDHWCKPPYDLRDLSADAWKNMSIPVEADGTFSKCTMYDPGVTDNPEANRPTVPCQSWDYNLTNKFESLTSRYDLVCDRRYLSNVRVMLPVIVGGILTPLLGFASDRVGRRPVLLMAVFVLFLGAYSNCVAETIAVHILTRALIFVGFNTTFLLTFILLYEVTGNRWRPLYTILHSAVGAIMVPPAVGAVSVLQPRWALSQALLLVPTTVLAVWCCFVNESPAWLLDVRGMKQAEAAVLKAAKMNGVDMVKAKALLHSTHRQLKTMDRSPQFSMDVVSAGEYVLETAKMNRRAASVFLARFTLSAVYFTLVRTQKTAGVYWLTAELFLLIVCFWTACWAMVRYNVRDTLSALLAIVCVCSIAEALLISLGLSEAIPFAHLGTKVAVSGAGSVAFCYSAEIFPISIRSAGVSFCHVFNSGGSLSGVLLVAISGQNAGFALSTFSLVMTALSALAIQWLPEVFVEAPPPPLPADAMGDEERKEALKKSLASPESQKRRKRRKDGVKSPPKSPT